VGWDLSFLKGEKTRGKPKEGRLTWVRRGHTTGGTLWGPKFIGANGKW